MTFEFVSMSLTEHAAEILRPYHWLPGNGIGFFYVVDIDAGLGGEAEDIFRQHIEIKAAGLPRWWYWS